MQIIMNEKERALEALQTYNLGKDSVQTLNCVGKYYKSEGYKQGEIRQMLEGLIMRCDPKENIAKWDGCLTSIVRNAGKYPLVEVDNVGITQKELNICKSLNGVQKQRLMFTLICIAKFNSAAQGKRTGWVNTQSKDIFRMANLNTPTKRRALMLNDLRDAGLIQFSCKVDSTSINVVCLDHSGDPLYFITKFENLGHRYTMFAEGGHFECERCGAIVKKTGNNHKYCPECAAQAHREVVARRRKSLS